jgi:hypothetical protein
MTYTSSTSPLRSNYSVKDAQGQLVRSGLTLAEAVELASVDRYRYTIHWAGGA